MNHRGIGRQTSTRQTSLQRECSRLSHPVPEVPWECQWVVTLFQTCSWLVSLFFTTPTNNAGASFTKWSVVLRLRQLAGQPPESPGSLGSTCRSLSHHRTFTDSLRATG